MSKAYRAIMLGGPGADSQTALRAGMGCRVLVVDCATSQATLFPPMSYAHSAQTPSPLLDQEAGRRPARSSRASRFA